MNKQKYIAPIAIAQNAATITACATVEKTKGTTKCVKKSFIGKIFKVARTTARTTYEVIFRTAVLQRLRFAPHGRLQSPQLRCRPQAQASALLRLRFRSSPIL